MWKDEPGLPLGLEKGKDVVLANGALDVTAARNRRQAPRTRTSSFAGWTNRMMERVESSMNSTRTWVTPPRDPVRPSTLTTLASLTWVLEDSCTGGESERERSGPFSRPASSAHACGRDSNVRRPLRLPGPPAPPNFRHTLPVQLVRAIAPPPELPPRVPAPRVPICARRPGRARVRRRGGGCGRAAVYRVVALPFCDRTGRRRGVRLSGSAGASVDEVPEAVRILM